MANSRERIRRRGFTILDMLIVVVVIAILTSIAYPRFMVARDRAHIGAAQYDLVHIRAALAMYAADYDRYPDGLSSLEDLRETVIDPNGNPYMILPTGQTFRWVSYDLASDRGYILVIQALDSKNTLLTATADSVSG